MDYVIKDMPIEVLRDNSGPIEHVLTRIVEHSNAAVSAYDLIFDSKKIWDAMRETRSAIQRNDSWEPGSMLTELASSAVGRLYWGLKTKESDYEFNAFGYGTKVSHTLRDLSSTLETLNYDLKYVIEYELFCNTEFIRAYRIMEEIE